ncbi:MAG TPA: polysaccharide deacetylase family protein [Polyangiaceae bacterium]|nr:polysaccharide deacetylase family protein [Polyangiaceae bacterium]
MKQTIKGLLRRSGLRRSDVAAARMYCERQALARWGRRRPRQQGRILCYHSVGQPSFGVNDIPPQAFRQQLEWALKQGYRFVPAEKIARDGGDPRSLAVTFDDAFKTVGTQAAPILAEYGIPWSVFVVTNWSDGGGGWAPETFLNWSELRELADKGAEIGSHSVSHPDFGYLDGAHTRDELRRSREIMEERLGFAPHSFAIPFGQSKNWSPVATEAAREAGYRIVYAQAEGSRPMFTVPRTFITHYDNGRVFEAALQGVFDHWEEWV